MKTTSAIKLIYLGFTLVFSVGHTDVSLASTPCEPPPSGLVSWWPAEGTFQDIVGTNNGVAIGDVAFAPGIVGQAFSFNGTNDYISVPSSSSLDLIAGQGWTIEGWINLSTNTVQIIAKKGVYWAFYSHAGGSITFETSPNAGSVVELTTASTFAPGQWQHVAVVVDSLFGPVSGYHFYINGVDVGIGINGNYGQPSGNVISTEPLTIGAGDEYDEYQGAVLGDFCNGEIDELSIYDRALSPNEINNIYLAGSAGKCQTPYIINQPTISWTNPAPVVYGTALSSNQLDAIASVPGTFSYTPTNGTVLDPGTNTLSVVFTPTDTIDYSSATDSVSLVVLIPQPIINIQKAVYITSSNLWVGQDYQVQASSDLINWTNQGSIFTATNSIWTSTQYWNVSDWNQLFFRLLLAP